jgi:hypothetical protein
MPVLPLHIQHGPGMSTVMIGLVSRAWSGEVSDSRGAKCAVVIGMFAGIAAAVAVWLRRAPARSRTSRQRAVSSCKQSREQKGNLK